MAHDARWRCFQCNEVLGRVRGATLSVDVERVAEVLATPSATTVTCAACRAERSWTPRPTRAA